MKKFLAVLAIAGTLVACNNESETTTSTDSTTLITPTTVDSLTVDTTVNSPLVDTTAAGTTGTN